MFALKYKSQSDKQNIFLFESKKYLLQVAENTWTFFRLYPAAREVQRQGAGAVGKPIPLLLAHGVCGPGEGTQPAAYTLLALAQEFESTAT